MNVKRILWVTFGSVLLLPAIAKGQCSGNWVQRPDGSYVWTEYCEVRGTLTYAWSWVHMPTPYEEAGRHGRRQLAAERDEGMFRGDCGDERTTIIDEYVNRGVDWVPHCHAFASGGGTTNFSWEELNRSPGSGHPPWGIVRDELWTGLESTRAEYNRGGIIINSGYRCPHGNAAVGGATQSRHQWGDAADMRSQDYPWNFDEWTLLKQAAERAGATFIEDYSLDPSHPHADWR